jgi:hypothetical protein
VVIVLRDGEYEVDHDVVEDGGDDVSWEVVVPSEDVVEGVVVVSEDEVGGGSIEDVGVVEVVGEVGVEVVGMILLDDDDEVVITVDELSNCCRRSTCLLTCNSTGSAATAHINNPKTTTIESKELRIFISFKIFR